MSVLFYMDQNIPAAITNGLRHRGVEVLTAFEDGTADWDDEPILERATQLGRAVFTFDDDFLAIASEWLQQGREFTGVVFARPLAVTIGQAIRDLELIAAGLDTEDMRNHIEFLPLS